LSLGLGNGYHYTVCDIELHNVQCKQTGNNQGFIGILQHTTSKSLRMLQRVMLSSKAKKYTRGSHKL